MGGFCGDVGGRDVDPGIRGRSGIAAVDRDTRGEAEKAELRPPKSGIALNCPRWEDIADKWGAEMAFTGESDHGPMRELPHRPVQSTTNMGSFDCVSFRFANGNSAQDDRLI